MKNLLGFTGAEDFLREDVHNRMYFIRGYKAWNPKAPVPELGADLALVEMAAAAMTNRLLLARMHTRAGWWNREVITLDQLNYLLRKELASETPDMVDVMNYAAMIYVRSIADE
jgi:hypothetical protein